MTSSVLFPNPEEVGLLLTGIVGRGVNVKKSAPMDLKAPAAKTYGIYHDAEADEAALCVMDYSLAAYSGGAMVMFPKDVVSEAVKGAFSPGLLDAVGEILNVCAQVLNKRSHMTLQKCCLKRAELPQPLAALLDSPADRLDLEVSVADWGSGRMTFLAGRKAQVTR